MADFQSYIGATFAIARGVKPATRDKAGYEALGAAWVVVGKIKAIPEIGDSHNMIEIDVLSLGRVINVIGSAVGGANQVSLVADIDDAGQIQLALANGSNTENSFRIIDPAPSNEAVYFGGLVAGLKDNERSTTVEKGKVFVMPVNTAVLRTTAP